MGCCSIGELDEISPLYLQKNIDKFCRRWQSTFSKHPIAPLETNNCGVGEKIAEGFKQELSNVYYDSSADGAAFIECIKNLHASTRSETNHSNMSEIENVEHDIKALKFGKTCGYDNISKESITRCHLAIYVHLKLLFNVINEHGMVPDEFGKRAILYLS